MNEQLEKSVQCPYCGEVIDVLVDDSVPQQNYIEDCQVCCSPINFDVDIGHGGEVVIVVSNENE